METIDGKHTRPILATELAARTAGYRDVLVDLGTGDGRFVAERARQSGIFAIGVDACREQLRDASRRAAANALYLIANAEALPLELEGLATTITINFPWGSLLQGLVAGHDGLLNGLCRTVSPGAHLEVGLNGGALAEAGLSLEEGGSRVVHMLRGCGFVVARPMVMDREVLRTYPTSWARRLAFGRDPRALMIHGRWPAMPFQEDLTVYARVVVGSS